MDLSLSVSPEPVYDQVMAYELYIFNLTYMNIGLNVMPDQPVDPAEEHIKYTGKLVAVLELTWKGHGSYDFGDASTGYNFNLEQVQMNQSLSFPLNGTESWTTFNVTLSKDAFDFGVKPYEEIEIEAEAGLYYEVFNTSVGALDPFKGPLITKVSRDLMLLDDTKISYVEGKFEEMAEEVSPLVGINNADFNVSRFLGYLDAVNMSITIGDYFEALESYEDYDEKHRASLIFWLTKGTNESITKSSIIISLEIELEMLTVEFDVLENKYLSLSSTYQRRQAELEAAKQNLSTAITAVFLTAVLMFFAGRWSVSRKTYEQDTDIEEVSPDAEPSIR
ncbi:MAG: hypothetical protein NWE89_13040 [Candidatus Bathyarchaeota archaeon]|nr:hypothetical protein [Candidatus Bathyarchaeota archaeon]